MLEEAKKRDHRRIGREMDLFMMRDEAPGFPFFLPGGVLVYSSKPHSYRELPIRAGEIGLVHRHELKGALHGLFRVRCFNQDDAHLFVTPEQLTDEIVGVVRLIDSEYQKFAFNYHVELSTRPEDFNQDDAHLFVTPEQLTDEIVGVVRLIDSEYQKFAFNYHVELSTRPEDSMGSDEDWAAAEEGLKVALDKLGMEYVVNEGDGAFYGPKIDFHLEDSLGRTWQCGTVQLDFQMPQNFDLTYVDADGVHGLR